MEEEKAMKKRFEEWMVAYSRTYKDEEEKAMRYEIFRHTAQFVDEHNARPGVSFTCATNKFADWTKEEFNCCHGGACVPKDELAQPRRDQDQS